MLATADIFLFEEFRLDRHGEGLSRRDERGVFVPLSVGPRALDVLRVLIERAGELVTKQEIMAAVWGRAVVENANLTVQISALRRVLDEGRTDGSCIQTVAARGYRFVAPVTRIEHATPLPVVRDEAVAALPATSVTRAVPRRYRTKLAIMTSALLAALVIASLAWWVWPSPSFPTASIQIATSMPQPIAPRLSIVVLPLPTSATTRPAIFCRWHHRRSDYRFVADRGHARNLTQYCVRISEQADQRQADRPRSARAIYA